MAVVWTCDDHPDAPIGEVTDEVLMHVKAHHPGAKAGALIETGTIRVGPAAKEANRLRIFGCRRCGALTETYDDDRRPYCDDCLGDGA